MDALLIKDAKELADRADVDGRGAWLVLMLIC